jgi:hypothetical protein
MRWKTHVALSMVQWQSLYCAAPAPLDQQPDLYDKLPVRLISFITCSPYMEETDQQRCLPPRRPPPWCISRFTFGPSRIHYEWGADQELDADCKWLFENDYPHKVASVYLRKARRPKPPSLKEQALELVRRIEGTGSPWALSELGIVRRALEALDD